jgi:hypothetical protein
METTITRTEIISRLLALPAEIAQTEKAHAVTVLDREQLEAEAIRNGIVEGKNEMERKAHLASLLHERDRDVARTRIALHTLQNELAALRAISRILAGPEA